MLSLKSVCRVDRRINLKHLHEDFLKVCRASRSFSDTSEPTNDKVEDTKSESRLNDQISTTDSTKSEVAVKTYPNFESRLEHYKKLGIKVEPKIINVPDEPKINPIFDKAIEVFQGKPPAAMAAREIITENSDPRSITTFPPSNYVLPQKWHEEFPEETTLGFPVIRPPHPLERWREGMRMTKSGPAKYPWIQEFQHHYDIVIVGGGLVGSFIAYWLAQRVDVKAGMRVAVVEKDPTYRHSLTTTSALGLRMQHSLPENIEMSLFGADFLRNIGRKMAIPFDEVSDDDYFNIPNIKFQPHGHLTLAREDQMQDLLDSHEMQRQCGVQSALLTTKQINLRFPWINTHGIAGGCLGLEAEGWFDSWNLLQAVKLKNIHQGVDYIHGEVIYFKKHSLDSVASTKPSMGQFEDGTHIPLGRNYEAHVLLPDSQQVYPLHFNTCMMAGGGATGDIGRMAGIGEGYGVMGVEIPVERKRGYVFNVNCKTGPGLNCPLTVDPSGLFMRREGHGGDYLVGKLPDGKDIPVNMHGDVDPAYWEEEILPTLQGRVDRFDSPTLMGSHAVDYDYNYYDGSPIIGPHPYMGNMWMACGFNGLGAQMAPAVGRAMMELFYDTGYCTIDLSRFAFDRIMNDKAVKEKSCQMFARS
eukprot:GFUD01041598.1.p1 GENE.GFUD01041598.1~~GFUD01041598.1.p1  ORF type:complete len:654 (-),score=163.88 GFUD01041598.1:101-2023(-)